MNKWRTIVGVALLYLAFFLNWNWVWSLMIFYWMLPGLFTGTSYFVEAVSRKENPVVFWAMTLSWLAVAVYLLIPGMPT